MVEPLTPDDLAVVLPLLNGWEGDIDGIRRSYKAPAFLTGIALVDAVAQAAEAADHHPDIDIRWCTVTFALSTHTVGAVTSKDIDLARAIDAAAAEHGCT